MQKMHLAWLVAALWGCADRNIDLGLHVEELHRADGSAVDVSGCAAVDGAITERACVLDSNGTNYALGEDPELIVVSSAPPYGGYVEFVDGLTIDSAALGNVGDAAPVHAYAAPYNIHGNPATPELDAAHLVAVNASIAVEGGLILTVEDALPSGTQLAIDLQFANLLVPLPAGSPRQNFLCPGGGFECAGYTLRFYVGEEPPLTGAQTPVSASASKLEPSP